MSFKIDDRVFINGFEDELGTVVAIDRFSVTIEWDDGEESTFDNAFGSYDEIKTAPAESGNNKEGQMAQKVRGSVIGGSEQTFDNCSTVGDVAKQLGAGDRTATMNGATVTHDTALTDYAYVVFTDKKKGGV